MVWASVFIALWYIVNLVSNTYSKRLFDTLPDTYIVALQSLVGAFIALLWNLVSRKRVLIPSKSVATPALMHTVAHLYGFFSIRHYAKFFHFVKCLEPLFTVILTYLVQGTKPSLAVTAALAIVMGGVATASMKSQELTLSGISKGLTRTGALLALATNFGTACRGVLSKQLMTGKDKKKQDEQGQAGVPTGGELYDEIALMSALFALGPALLIDGDKLAGVMSKLDAPLLTHIVISGVAYHIYHRLAFSALELLPALTISVASSVKISVFQIIAYIIFGSQLSRHAAWGAGVSAFGVLLLAYANVKTSPKKSKPNEIKAHAQ